MEKVNEFKAPGLIVNPLRQAELNVPSVALIARTFVFKILTPLKLTTPDEFEGVPEFTDVATEVVQDESE